MMDVDAEFAAAVEAYADDCQPGAGAVVSVQRVGGYGRAVVACPERPSGVAQALLVFDERAWSIVAAGGTLNLEMAGFPPAVVAAMAALSAVEARGLEADAAGCTA